MSDYSKNVSGTQKPTFRYIPITIEQTRAAVRAKTIKIGVPNEISNENASEYAKKLPCQNISMKRYSLMSPIKP